MPPETANGSIDHYSARFWVSEATPIRTGGTGFNLPADVRIPNIATGAIILGFINMTDHNILIDSLLDHQMIQAAKDTHQTTGERRARAAAEVAAARDAQKQAAAISDAAARRGEVVAATAAETALEDAERRVRVAKKLHEASEHAHRASDDALTLATRHAHLPVLLSGVRGRIAAASKADKAMAMLQEAQTEMRLADRLIAASYSAAGAPSAPYLAAPTCWSLGCHVAPRSWSARFGRVAGSTITATPIAASRHE